jgi:hypothetical protein
MGGTLRFVRFKDKGQEHGAQLILMTADQRVRTLVIPGAAQAVAPSPAQ